MRTKFLLAILLCACVAEAKDPPSYQKGTLLQMESAPCGYAEKSGKSIGGEILGTDSAHKKTQEVLCQEYTLQADRIIYRIRPKDDKHPILLPVGETVQFRIHKDMLLLRNPEGDSKEREYFVLSMTSRTDVKDPRAISAEKQSKP